MALGGVPQPLILSQLQGGNAPQPIDYSHLASALQKVQLSASVRDTKAAKVRDDFTQRMANI
jgi:hypothetical protein